jgi:hypothetical protein
MQAGLAHEPLDRATGHGVALAAQLVPNLAGAVHTEVVGVDASDMPSSSASRTARADGGAFVAAQYRSVRSASRTVTAHGRSAPPHRGGPCARR